MFKENRFIFDIESDKGKEKLPKMDPLALAKAARAEAADNVSGIILGGYDPKLFDDASKEAKGKAKKQGPILGGYDPL